MRKCWAAKSAERASAFDLRKEIETLSFYSLRHIIDIDIPVIIPNFKDIDIVEVEGFEVVFLSNLPSNIERSFSACLIKHRKTVVIPTSLKSKRAHYFFLFHIRYTFCFTFGTHSVKFGTHSVTFGKIQYTFGKTRYTFGKTRYTFDVHAVHILLFEAFQIE